MNDDQFLGAGSFSTSRNGFSTLVSYSAHFVFAADSCSTVCPSGAKISEHGVAGSDCLLIGNPERFKPACFIMFISDGCVRYRSGFFRWRKSGPAAGLQWCTDAMSHIIKHSKTRIGFTQSIQLRLVSRGYPYKLMRSRCVDSPIPGPVCVASPLIHP